MYTFHQLRQRAHEWEQSLWIAAIDFKKAFDTIEHISHMATVEVPAYIHIQPKLYNMQTTVSYGCGLFNALLKHIMAPFKNVGGQQKRIRLGEHEKDHNPSKPGPTHDILPVASLSHHAACNSTQWKTEILSNFTKPTQHQHGQHLVLPPDEQIQYQGQIITFKEPMQAEQQHRTKCAWAHTTGKSS